MTSRSTPSAPAARSDPLIEPPIDATLALSALSRSLVPATSVSRSTTIVTFSCEPSKSTPVTTTVIRSPTDRSASAPECSLETDSVRLVATLTTVSDSSLRIMSMSPLVSTLPAAYVRTSSPSPAAVMTVPTVSALAYVSDAASLMAASGPNVTASVSVAAYVIVNGEPASAMSYTGSRTWTALLTTLAVPYVVDRLPGTYSKSSPSTSVTLTRYAEPVASTPS